MITARFESAIGALDILGKQQIVDQEAFKRETAKVDALLSEAIAWPVRSIGLF